MKSSELQIANYRFFKLIKILRIKLHLTRIGTFRKLK